MIAAGHMAILNLGYGRTAEAVDVRLLLIGPGIAWIVIFAGAYGTIAGARTLVSRGRFTSIDPVLANL